MTDQEFLTQLKAELEKIRVPVGAIMPYRGTTAPDGWLVVNGQNVYESVYPDLYNFLKVQPNAKTGTDSTGAFVKCELPHHRVIELTTTVSEVGQLVEAGLPDISGTAFNFCLTKEGYGIVATGAFGNPGVGGDAVRPSQITIMGERNLDSFDFSASRSSSVFGKSQTNQNASLRLLAIVKY